MRALVGVKRVIDYAVKIRIKQDKSGVEKSNVKMSINPFCEIAVEEAVRMKEKKILSHISAFSIGDKNSAETLRHALALGADDAFHVLTNDPIDTNIQPLLVAKIMKLFIEKHKIDMVLLGKQVKWSLKQAIDDDSNQTSQILSALMGWPLATFASGINKIGENQLEVTREVDSGLQKVVVDSPCILSCDLRLNTPRYTGIKNITAAKKKKIEEVKIETLGLDIKPRFQVLQVVEPAAKKGGIKVKDVDELIDKLRNEAKVI